MRKKKLLIATLIFAMMSCGNNNSTVPEQATAENTNDQDISNVAIFKNTDCGTCHRKSETFTGPSFTDIADRYVNAADTTITRLAGTIINGSSGNWKGMVAAMTPHPAISKSDAEAMVKYILTIKK